MVDSLDLKTIFQLVLTKIWWIVSGTVLCAVIAFLLSYYLITPTYTSSTILYVNANPASTNTQSNLNDINFSQKLVNTYIVILKNKTVLELVSNELSVPMSPAAIGATLSMSAVNDTEVMEIKSTTNNPELSAEICNVLAKVAPDELKRIVKAGSVEVVSPAVASYTPSSPNVSKNTIIGALLGLVISMGIILLMYILDNTIKSSDELQRAMDIAVLGEIADFEASTKGGTY